MANHKTIIRKARKSDYTELRKLWYEFGYIYTKEDLLKPLNMKWLEAYRDENKMIDKITDDFTNGKYTVYVAENDGKLIGFIGGSIKENADKTYSKMGYIEDWFVTEKWRGQGIGQSLYDKLAEDFKDCDYLSLYAYLSNPAIEMYKKMGFAPCSLMMVKKIGVSNPSKKEEK